MYSETGKLQFEVEKLKEEIRTLKRPYISQPNSWITMIGLIISVIFNFSQCSRVEKAKELALIQVAQAKLDADNFKKINDSLKVVRDYLTMTGDSLHKKDSILKTNYLAASNQFDSLQKKIEQTKDLLEQLEINKSIKNLDSSTVFKALRKSIDKINILNKNALDSFKVSGSFIKNPINNLPLASEKEREGFQSLLDANYDQALAAFITAENAYNGYHEVYEISRLLKQNLPELKKNPDKRNSFLRQIVDNYSKSAPQDIIEQIKNEINN